MIPHEYSKCSPSGSNTRKETEIETQTEIVSQMPANIAKENKLNDTINMYIYTYGEREYVYIYIFMNINVNQYKV